MTISKASSQASQLLRQFGQLMDFAREVEGLGNIQEAKSTLEASVSSLKSDVSKLEMRRDSLKTEISRCEKNLESAHKAHKDLVKNLDTVTKESKKASHADAAKIISDARATADKILAEAEEAKLSAAEKLKTIQTNISESQAEHDRIARSIERMRKRFAEPTG